MEKKQSSYQKFIILTMPRSGSNYLSYLLHDHPQIMSMGEIYCLETIWGQPGKTEINHHRLLKLFRDLFPVTFLKKIVFHEYSPSIKAVGFRLFYHQAEHYYKLLKYLLSLVDLKVIHLKRANLLENLVSFRLAIKTDVWSSLRSPLPKITRISLSFKECLDYFESSLTTREKFDKLFGNFPTLDIYYEKLCESPDREVRKILSFLNVRKCHLSCPLKKQNRYALKKIIINYQELKKQFINTQWRDFFA